MSIPKLEAPEKKSSTVESFGYDKEQQELYIKFYNSGLYRYNEVTDDEYNQLLQSESFGSFVAKEIIKKHKCVRVSINN